ncbi:surfeit locus protein 6 homolog [Physella acuta]|uniref:surfeit locus protein 6 homolog n=1 Tax=Physella acuta TaxID=109671 RepID=UPI0027DD9061|nr:surfeit locus protein 6 homolog [Physella acuta]XP_059157686.1 surfeit locus protein 6 homolog [Physella acuta]XP_059157687.1 surfeit locus protein 6 homolog [Physella acuta]XP_059157688.1 surfeit locus protein 6 homolog [Physella acuta]
MVVYFRQPGIHLPMIMMTGSESHTLELVKCDNSHFKALLDLIPPQSYFKQEEKQEIYGNSSDEDDDPKSKKKKKPKKGVPLSSLSVTQITELRQQGLNLGNKKAKNIPNGTTEEASYSIEDKHKGKKLSRSAKGKLSDKELARRESRHEELRERLRLKLEELKARKNKGGVSSQEQKRLKRQEKKVNDRLKSKNKGKHKELRMTPVAEGLKSSPQNRILNQNGEPVKSKFDFSNITFGNEKQHSSDLHGKDYKRLLEKVEARKAKVEKLKEKDPEAGKKLEQKMQWQNVLSKAKGEKVKDDPNLLKKAVKRKEKLRESKQKKWGERVKNVEDMKQKRQDKRQANIDKRKEGKKDKKRKIMIKKGRIIPGF